MWLILGFAFTGFLIGNLMAMSASSTVPSFLGLLFALLGGSLIALLHKLKQEDRTAAGKIVLALSAMCLLGVYTGLVINERELLTPKERRFWPAVSKSNEFNSAAKPETSHSTDCSSIKTQASKYLAGAELSKADGVDLKKQRGEITPEQAYAEMYNGWKKFEGEVGRCF